MFTHFSLTLLEANGTQWESSCTKLATCDTSTFDWCSRIDRIDPEMWNSISCLTEDRSKFINKTRSLKKVSCTVCLLRKDF